MNNKSENKFIFSQKCEKSVKMCFEENIRFVMDEATYVIIFDGIPIKSKMTSIENGSFQKELNIKIAAYYQHCKNLAIPISSGHNTVLSRRLLDRIEEVILFDYSTKRDFLLVQYLPEKENVLVEFSSLAAKKNKHLFNALSQY